MPMVLYHNPRCSKSRQALALLEEKGVSFQIKDYLKEGLTKDEVHSILGKLGEDRDAIIRTKEDLYKEAPFEVSDDELVIKNLMETPKLLERPILVTDSKAIIGRPVEKIEAAI